VSKSNPGTTRRDFVKQAIAAGIILASSPAPAFSNSSTPPVLLNQVGFPTQATKLCLLAASASLPYSILQSDSGGIVWQGTMNVVRGDFGTYVVGDFSDFTKQGTFQLSAGGSTSQSFDIGADVYLDHIRNSIAYFSIQRCGNSTTGYNAPCHLDDGHRLDQGQHQNVTGGWHDACDLRKWVDSTIYGMVGLARVLGYLSSATDRNAIIEEMRWGNLYFRNMQNSAGHLMDYCGGDDGNYFTDNIVGTSDDRSIHTEVCGLPAQFHFIASQAALVRALADPSSAYAHGCLVAAELCLDWIVKHKIPTAAVDLGAGVIACTQLFVTTQSAHYSDIAVSYGNQLMALQARTGSLRGFFHSDQNVSDPFRDAENGNLPLLALCDLLEAFPKHADAPRWQSALSLHCEYLVSMSARSGLGIVPYGLYSTGDPGGDRRLDGYWYRWFMEVSGTANTEMFWVGINTNLASSGIGLSRAATLLNNSSFASLAQRQLDWILGANPFAASTVIGAGYNQPTLYRTNAFSPNTPLIPGGVMNGIGGTVLDRPDIADGSYHTCEYWTPMVAYTMWLMAELQSSGA
jgi:hypothetical protein